MFLKKRFSLSAPTYSSSCTFLGSFVKKQCRKVSGKLKMLQHWIYLTLFNSSPYLTISKNIKFSFQKYHSAQCRAYGATPCQDVGTCVQGKRRFCFQFCLENIEIWRKIFRKYFRIGGSLSKKNIFLVSRD